MGTYVISDIHGCFDEFMELLRKIRFCESDTLYLAGDYVDRGKQSAEMLAWLCERPKNVFPIKGNHDEEFATYISIMTQIDEQENLRTDAASPEDAWNLYNSVEYALQKRNSLALAYFDSYGTVSELISEQHISLGQLSAWAEMLRKLPLYQFAQAGNRQCVIVHAGYADAAEDFAGLGYDDAEEFYLYARKDSIRLGGVRGGMVVAGHTPTIIKSEFAYNGGEVFRFYDKAKDCIFYDIDCGCAYYELEPTATLACLRLEDEEVVYL